MIPTWQFMYDINVFYLKFPKGPTPYNNQYSAYFYFISFIVIGVYSTVQIPKVKTDLDGEKEDEKEQDNDLDWAPGKRKSKKKKVGEEVKKKGKRGQKKIPK